MGETYLFIDFNETYFKEGLDAYSVEVRSETEDINEVIAFKGTQEDIINVANEYKKNNSEIAYIISNLQ